MGAQAVEVKAVEVTEEAGMAWEAMVEGGAAAVARVEVGWVRAALAADLEVVEGPEASPPGNVAAELVGAE